MRDGPDGPAGIGSDTWLNDVASDGVSTVFLDVSGGGPPVVWRTENEPWAMITSAQAPEDPDTSRTSGMLPWRSMRCSFRKGAG